MRRKQLALAAAAVAVGVLITSTGTSRHHVVHTDATTTTSTALRAAAPTSDTATPATPSPVTAASELGSGETVTIAFAGDMNFETGMDKRLAANPATAVGPFTPILKAADLAVGNLETSVGTHGTPEKKEFTFQAPPSAITALRAGGFDTVSLANNHGRDFGAVGLADSLAVSAAQADHFLIGLGKDDTEAYAPFRATIKGQRIAVIGATQVIDGEFVSSWTAAPGHPGLASAKEVEKLAAAVKAARDTSDTVIVFLHWGVERNTCPSADQKALARALADAGADIVIGGHAHRLQGAGYLGKTFVGYGLGNFNFYANGAEAARTGVVQVKVTGHRVDAYEFIPGKISGSLAQPLTGAAATEAKAYWESLRPCTALSATPTS